jgi:hypothetical protein
MSSYNKLILPELTGLKKEKELDDLIGDLYETDGYLAGAITTMRKDLIKKGIGFMEELLNKIKKIKTNASQKEDAIKYIQESIKVSKSFL